MDEFIGRRKVLERMGDGVFEGKNERNTYNKQKNVNGNRVKKMEQIA